MNGEDRIYARMPERLDYFLAATAVLQDYCVQLHKQLAQRQKHIGFKITVEVANDSYLFFWPVFPRMDMVVRSEAPLAREDWDYVLDLHDTDRCWELAAVPKKHATEAWGIMFGASPQRLPLLGPMQPPVSDGSLTDVLFDERVPQTVREELESYIKVNCPNLNTATMAIEHLRPATLHDVLSDVKMFIAMRGNASYMAAAMLKPMIELYPDDMPSFFMAKQHNEFYRMFYGTTFKANMIWPFFEDMYAALIGEPEAFMVQGVT